MKTSKDFIFQSQSVLLIFLCSKSYYFANNYLFYSNLNLFACSPSFFYPLQGTSNKWIYNVLQGIFSCPLQVARNQWIPLLTNLLQNIVSCYFSTTDFFLHPFSFVTFIKHLRLSLMCEITISQHNTH